MPEPRRYEREIDEILRRFERQPPRRPRGNPLVPLLDALATAWRRLNSITRARTTAEQLIVWSLGLVLLTFVLGYISPRLAYYASILSVLMFVAAIVLSISGRGGSSSRQKRWRGKVIDLPPSNRISLSGLAWRLRQWLRRRA